jgi:hypothetical protein
METEEIIDRIAKSIWKEGKDTSLYNRICVLIEGDNTPQTFIDRWNFITDIDTNEIRECARGEAVALLIDLEEYFKIPREAIIK